MKATGIVRRIDDCVIIGARIKNIAQKRNIVNFIR